MLAANSQGVNRWPRLNRRAGLRMKELLQARGPTVDDPQGLATGRWRREALCLEPYEQLGRRWWPRPWLARTNRTVCQVQSNGCARDFEPGRNWCGKQRRTEGGGEGINPGGSKPGAVQGATLKKVWASPLCGAGPGQAGLANR